jgi:hypothetical protein
VRLAAKLALIRVVSCRAFLANNVHSMPEVSHACEDHGHAMLVRSGDHLGIAY